MLGISFMVRVRNEEKTLEKSIRSLFKLSIPYEIIIILHKCTDKSEEISKKLQKENNKIFIYYYDYEISKCGYENLCTNKESLHSMVKYSNSCLEKTSFKWKFKWDGDFIASEALIEFLNKNDWNNINNVRYKINAKNSTSNNIEYYLSDSIKGYDKYIFWEIPIYDECQNIELEQNICIYHDSELYDCKAYWKSKIWFLNVENEEEIEEAKIIKEKYINLINDYGIEPIGMARASNPLCDEKYLLIINGNPKYVNFYN